MHKLARTVLRGRKLPGGFMLKNILQIIDIAEFYRNKQ